MTTLRNNSTRKPLATLAYSAGRVCLALAVALSVTGGVALAAPSAVTLSATAPGLGAAASFSVLGKAGVTNSGPSVLSGNVGADSSITGFPPGSAATQILAPAVNGAEADALTADLALTAQAGSAMPAGPNLTGATLVPGVYDVGSALLPGTLTLNGPGVYIFLASDLTASGSVNFINGASACNVFWHVTAGAAITGGSFAGTIIAGTSITFGNAASLNGRALALTGNVTLINNSIFGPGCTGGPSVGGSYVSVSYVCATDGNVVVTVGMSAGVTVYGLGAPISSALDTGDDKIVRILPAGHYDWQAAPPAGHWMIDTASGVVDSTACGPADIGGAATATVVGAPTAMAGAPTATVVGAPTATAGGPTATATVEGPILIPNTGADLAEEQALAARPWPWIPVSLGFLSLGLMLLGFALRRKRGDA